MSKRNTIQVKVDKDIWLNVRSMFPKESDPTRSRLLFNTSLLRIEKKLGDVDFKDKLGEFIYGRKNWKRR